MTSTYPLFDYSAYRCAVVCVHAKQGTDTTDLSTARCWHPEATRGCGPVTIEAARARGAFCGPEALRLVLKGE